MMTMHTQFGDMKITDDNKTIVNDDLKKELEAKVDDNIKLDLTLADEESGK